MIKDFANNVQYNVKIVHSLLIIVNHVLMIEFQDLNPLVHAQMANTQVLTESVKTVHSDVVYVLITQTTVLMNVVMKPES
jgi:hypothetical protein